jgi:hypothetical protein
MLNGLRHSTFVTFVVAGFFGRFPRRGSPGLNSKSKSKSGWMDDGTVGNPLTVKREVANQNDMVSQSTVDPFNVMNWGQSELFSDGFFAGLGVPHHGNRFSGGRPSCC